jgi:hypothetical protein
VKSNLFANAVLIVDKIARKQRVDGALLKKKLS